MIVQIRKTVQKERNLLLVDPYPRDTPYHLTASERRAMWFPKLSLAVIAAYTPPGWHVELVDEAVQEVLGMLPDWVSAVTCLSTLDSHVF